MNVTAKKFEELTTAELYEILKSRSEIFLLEQNIICRDMDDVDYNALHCFIMDNKRVAAYFRAYYGDESKQTVKIGRVLTLSHGRGLGKELMSKGLAIISKKMSCKKICMDAQKSAVGFYEKFGFKVTSGEFLEEGVIHVRMELDVG